MANESDTLEKPVPANADLLAASIAPLNETRVIFCIKIEYLYIVREVKHWETLTSSGVLTWKMFLKIIDRKQLFAFFFNLFFSNIFKLMTESDVSLLKFHYLTLISFFFHDR
jgi:hypothetical protein